MSTLGRCRACRYFKRLNADLGMCQSPSEAKTRGADKGRGWIQTEPSDLCFNRDFVLIHRETKEQQG
jgi:hypothetical protein